MAKVIKNNLGKFLITWLIFSLITGWFYSGWPKIFKNPSIPPEIQQTMASTTSWSATTTVAISWTVPTNVYSITIKAWGAGGGGGVGETSGEDGGAGGGGGFAKGIFAVNPGDVLKVYVGGGGTGGKTTNLDGAGGGGLTGVFLTSTSTPLIIAGSGGGGGGCGDISEEGGSGGGGGGNDGTAGTGSTGAAANGGSGGLQTGGGAGGTGTAGTDGQAGDATGRRYYGGGGANVAGSTGGAALGGPIYGGNGGTGSAADSGGGGGGGAGYYGGGGGEAGQNTTAGEGGGGGGGGSSYILNYISGSSNYASSTGGTRVLGTVTGGWAANTSTDSDYLAPAGVGGNGGVLSAGTMGQPGRVVIILNTTPSFTGVGPADSPDPVNAGQPVTFSGTAVDPESDTWYLAACKTNWVATTTPPTCAAGQDYCVSASAAASNSSNSCNWTSSGSGTLPWYTFACDSGNALEIRCSAASTSDITVNAVSISISRTDSEGTISYGTVNVSDSTSTDPAGQNKTTIFQNNGNVAEKFSIQTGDAVNGTGWTAVSGTPGANQFRHSFATTSPVINWQVMGLPPPTDTWAIASSSVAVNGTLNIYLKLETPSASDYVIKDIAVTVFAEQAP